jgi:hypothetical protein
MKTNQDRGDSEPFGVLYSANDVVNSPSGAVAAPIASRRPFPLRTLMVCFTIWLIATQAMIFDELKFATRVHLLEQVTQSLGGSHVVVPNEQPSGPSADARLQTL